MMPKDLTIASHSISNSAFNRAVGVMLFANVTKAGSPIPGDLVIFDNPTAKDGDDSPYRYENTIYMGEWEGKQWYFGHPFGVVDKQTLLDKLKKESGASAAATPEPGKFFRGIS